MLHAKFQDHRTSGSGEEDFLRFLPYNMGMARVGKILTIRNFPCGKSRDFP